MFIDFKTLLFQDEEAFLEEMFSTGWRQYVPGLMKWSNICFIINIMEHMLKSYIGIQSWLITKLFIKHPPAYEIIVESKSLAMSI